MITKRTSHVVVSVANGNEALKMAELEKPDLILMDVVMPGMDGLEVCRRLRKQGVTAAVPIVLLTFRVGEEIRAEGFASGCTDLLKKPLGPDDLVNALRKHLGA
jgi:CheY-like chemotaxis protein